MRVPVYPRGSNPRSDRPILRKSLSYAEEQVYNFLADWIDPSDHTKGIIAREFIPSGKVLAAEPEQLACLSDKAMGIKVIPAKMEQNPTLPRLQSEAIIDSAMGWDWSQEPIPA